MPHYEYTDSMIDCLSEDELDEQISGMFDQIYNKIEFLTPLIKGVK